MKGFTLIEKILLKHVPSNEFKDFVYAKVNFCFGNDITAPLAVKEFVKAGLSSVFNVSKIGFICDHFLPARDLKAANNARLLREFSKKFRIKNFFDIDRCGVEHAFLVEEGLVKPGDLIVGADSHTCTWGALGAASFGVGSTDLAAVMKEGKVWLKVPKTIKFIYKGRIPKWISGKDLILYTIGKIGVDGALYKVMEFSGPVFKKLPMEDRFTMTNMAVEAGAKTGIFEFDFITLDYLKRVFRRKIDGSKYTGLKSDEKASYDDVMEIDVSRMGPQVSCPHLPSNVRPVDSLKKVKIDQVFIGSCTNGRITDLRIAAKILRGRKVKKGVRAIVIPATPMIYSQAEEEGLIKSFSDSGCIVGPPTCGPCLGGHFGILDKGETALSTTNRNFIGRMGSPQSLVYLSSPAVAAASAIKGRITNPEEIN